MAHRAPLLSVVVPATDVAPLALSVVVPVRDEAANVRPLIAEIHDALAGLLPYEIIYVDDGSRDGTAEALAAAAAGDPLLRVIRHRQSCGQSAAIRTGVAAAHGALVATLDGDGQNDPRDIPALVEAFGMHAGAPRFGMVATRRRVRQDPPMRRIASRVANRVRARLLGDDVADTGCGLKLFARAAFLELPYFDHMHRFLPALMQREGYGVAVVAVGHRPRRAGRSKYGIWDRLREGVVDLLGVMWLQRRRQRPDVQSEG